MDGSDGKHIQEKMRGGGVRTLTQTSMPLVEYDPHARAGGAWWEAIGDTAEWRYCAAKSRCRVPHAKGAGARRGEARVPRQRGGWAEIASVGIGVQPNPDASLLRRFYYAKAALHIECWSEDERTHETSEVDTYMCMVAPQLQSWQRTALW